jgi:hypothetical protein
MFPKKLILVVSALVVIDLHGRRARKRGHPARPIKPTSPVSGKEMCTTYCSVCHELRRGNLFECGDSQQGDPELAFDLRQHGDISHTPGLRGTGE